jgi:cellulose synthase/poly-beta-1,6-N-acetylglucosamine synthase-like glycosyltransferase
MEINRIAIAFALVVIPLVVYMLVMGFFVLAAFLRRSRPVPGPGTPSVSIVIAARNEAQTLPVLMESLYRQQYPEAQIEIIIVDDHSDDGTAQLAETFQGVKVLRLAALTGRPTGKKAALTEGLKLAGGEIILLTDADCHPGTGWVPAMIRPFSEAGVQLVAGPVALRGKGFGAAFQELEFMGIMGSTAGSLAAGYPLMVNGANLAIRAKAYRDISGRIPGSSYASGDDMFAMMAVRKAYGKKALRFMPERDAMVFTKPLASLSAFFGQRVRWASKTGGYPACYIRAVAALVLLVCLGMLSAFGLGVVYPDFMTVFLGMFLLKSLTDVLVIVPVARIQGRLSLLWLIPVLQMVYPVYVVAVAIAGSFMRPVWKGRRIK